MISIGTHDCESAMVSLPSKLLSGLPSSLPPPCFHIRTRLQKYYLRHFVDNVESAKALSTWIYWQHISVFMRFVLWIFSKGFWPEESIEKFLKNDLIANKDDYNLWKLWVTRNPEGCEFHLLNLSLAEHTATQATNKINHWWLVKAWLGVWKFLT